MALSINVTSFSISPITGIVKEDFAVTYADVGLLFSIPTLIFVIFSVPGGILADLLGVKKVGGLGAIIMGISSTLRWLSPDFLTLLLFSSIFAVGWGITFPTLPKLISGWFPRRLLGTASGIYVMGMPIGGTITLALTLPLLFSLGGWKNALLVWGLLALAAAAVWWALVKSNPSTKTQPQSQHHSSHFSRGVWKNRNLWIASTILFMANVIFFTELGWLPLFFTERGLDSVLAALMVSTLTLGNIVGITSIPSLSDKIGLRKPFLAGFSLLLAITGYALLLTPAYYGWILLPLLGICIAAAFSFSFILPVELAKTSAVGSATGMVFSVGFLGGIVGPYMIGYFRDITGNFSLLPWIIVVASLAITGLALALPETGRRKRTLRARVEKLFQRYQRQLEVMMNDWEDSKAELARELEVLNKSMNDSREALHELEVLHEIGEIPGSLFTQRKKELEEAIRYLGQQLNFVKTSIEKSDAFMAQQRLGLKTTLNTLVSSEDKTLRETQIIQEKLVKLEEMYKTGKVKEKIYQKLKAQYEKKLGNLSSRSN